ncbi:hypothetical protein [Cerasicoccus arenae]|uniref:hypothetical protein n=1 Tax=Cerasicoccus arenae TaxID=424488 RepID=UPI001A24CDFA|nr:hypothetical protein [Cerasicoccus arenae]MBK1860071.1 hypothetical protein [Cerasicoccus arenae]
MSSDDADPPAPDPDIDKPTNIEKSLAWKDNYPSIETTAYQIKGEHVWEFRKFYNQAKGLKEKLGNADKSMDSIQNFKEFVNSIQDSPELYDFFMKNVYSANMEQYQVAHDSVDAMSGPMFLFPSESGWSHLGYVSLKGKASFSFNADFDTDLKEMWNNANVAASEATWDGMLGGPVNAARGGATAGFESVLKDLTKDLNFQITLQKTKYPVWGAPNQTEWYNNQTSGMADADPGRVRAMAKILNKNNSSIVRFNEK